MTLDLLHVLFNPSASGELRRALAIAGRDDRVVSSFDNLSFGPINPPDGELRTKWVEEKLGWTEWEDVVAGTADFWKEALTPGRKIAWMSRRTTLEYAGFLEWLWRLGAAPCEVVDLTDVTVVGSDQDGKPTPPMPAISLGLLSAARIIDLGLMDRAEPLSSVARDRYRETWRRLRAENSALRVLNADGLVSAPISFFDPLLLSCTTDRWQRAARIVGEALVKEMDDALLQSGDLLLFARLRTLVELGHLEARGDLLDIQRCEVRLPSQQN